MSEEIQKTIDVLTAKFGATGLELWNAVVTQVKMEGLIGIIGFLIVFIVWFFLILNMRKIDQFLDTSLGKEENILGGIITVLALIVVFFVGLALAVDLPESIKQTVNPIYYATQAVLGR